MGLRDLKLPEAVIEIPGGSFAVRGLSLNDIAFLVSRHGDQIKSVFAQMTEQLGSAGTPGLSELGGLLVPLLQSIPDLAAELIACAAGDPEAVDFAKVLPAPVQLEALEKLFNLTVESGGGAKKVAETVLRLAQGTTGLMATLNSPRA